jgi:ATP-binding cassette subfamily C protein CydC
MYLSIAVVGVRAFALGKAFFRYSERLVLHDATFRKATKRRTQIFESLVKRAPIGLSDTKLGSLLTNLVDDTEESLNEDLRYRPALVQSVAVTLAGVIIYFWLAPQFALLAILVLVSGAVAIYLGSRFSAGFALKQLNDLRAELAVATEVIVSRNRVLLAFGWEQQSLRHVDELTDRVSQAERKLAGTAGFLQSFIALATYVTILASALVSISSGALLPGEQVAVLVLLPLGIFEYLQALPSALHARAKAKIALTGWVICKAHQHRLSSK